LHYQFTTDTVDMYSKTNNFNPNGLEKSVWMIGMTGVIWDGCYMTEFKTMQLMQLASRTNQNICDQQNKP